MRKDNKANKTYIYVYHYPTSPTGFMKSYCKISDNIYRLCDFEYYKHNWYYPNIIRFKKKRTKLVKR